MKTLTGAMLLISTSSFCQNGINTQWTWIKGEDYIGAYPVFGTPGVSSPSVRPGKIAAPVVWTAQDGIIWIFGGLADSTGGFGMRSTRDLWKYDPVTNNFTYVSGDLGAHPGPGVFGTIGVPNASNKPPSHAIAKGWVSTTGDFYLFGGIEWEGAGRLRNDLWKYSPSTGLWTWMNGNSYTDGYGVYGSKGVPAPANTPGARSTYMSGVDASGNFWLFGGVGYGKSFSLQGELNDVWKYNTATNQWTWMAGSDVAGAGRNFGTMGIENSNNTPSGRYGGASWMDANNNLWIYGGTSLGIALNDLWKFNTSNNQWTWIKGDSAIAGAVFGNQGVFSASNQPMPNSNIEGWKDLNGDFWLFGGENTNLLWKYSRSLNQWMWVKGDTTSSAPVGVYGTRGVSSPTTKPGSRKAHATWVDAAGNFYLLGGIGVAKTSTVGSLNDLWKINSNQMNAGLTTALKDIPKLADVSFSPNPVRNILTVSGNSGDKFQLKIFSSSGAEVGVAVFTGRTEYSFQHLPPGTYFVQVTDMRNRKSATQVIVRQ